MRKFSMFLFILVLVILTACGTDDKEADQGEINEEQDIDVENIADEQNEDDEVTDKKESSSVSPPTDALGILEAAGEVTSQLTGMVLEGEIESFVEMSGIVTIDEKNEITGEITLDPYVEHLYYDTTSKLGGGKENSEFYLSDEAMYMHTSSDGWLSGALSPDEFGSVLTDAQFNNFSKHHDQFELSEEKGNYLLFFEGDGDIYKEVIYGAVRENWGEEGYEAVTSIVEGISGSYQLTIDKQTFHVVASALESEALDGEMTIVSSVSFEFSEFNEVDDVVIPDEVIENAKKLPGME